MTSELGQVGGVTDVQVDLTTGKVAVTGNGSVDDAAVRAAVEEAGYHVVG